MASCKTELFEWRRWAREPALFDSGLQRIEWRQIKSANPQVGEERECSKREETKAKLMRSEYGQWEQTEKTRTTAVKNMLKNQPANVSLQKFVSLATCAWSSLGLKPHVSCVLISAIPISCYSLTMEGWVNQMTHLTTGLLKQGVDCFCLCFLFGSVWFLFACCKMLLHCCILWQTQSDSRPTSTMKRCLGFGVDNDNLFCIIG